MNGQFPSVTSLLYVTEVILKGKDINSWNKRIQWSQYKVDLNSNVDYRCTASTMEMTVIVWIQIFEGFLWPEGLKFNAEVTGAGERWFVCRCSVVQGVLWSFAGVFTLCFSCSRCVVGGQKGWQIWNSMICSTFPEIYHKWKSFSGMADWFSSPAFNFWLFQLV